MSKNEVVKKLLMKYADVQIFSSSAKNLIQLQFYYKNVFVQLVEKPEDLIIALEVSFSSNKKTISENILLLTSLLDDFNADVKRLDDKLNSYIFCHSLYCLVRLNIIKNDNRNGLLAIYF